MTELFKGLPRKWKFGGYTYRVKVVEATHPGLTTVIDGETCENDGMTDFDQQVVYLAESMQPQRASVVVLHEAVHVMNHIYGVTDESTEEQFTTQIATALLAFWRDNGKVMTWLNKTRKLETADTE